MPKKQSKNWFGLAVVVLGAALLGLGLLRGELPHLFNRGINLCLACIGIG